jgi:hypothetical protein
MNLQRGVPQGGIDPPLKGRQAVVWREELAKMLAFARKVIRPVEVRYRGGCSSLMEITPSLTGV